MAEFHVIRAHFPAGECLLVWGGALFCPTFLELRFCRGAVPGFAPELGEPLPLLQGAALCWGLGMASRGVCFAASLCRPDCSVWGRSESSAVPFTGDTTTGRGRSKAEQVAPALCSGNDFVVAFCFDVVALSWLRDYLKFLLQEGEACP